VNKPHFKPKRLSRTGENVEQKTILTASMEQFQACEVLDKLR